MNLLVTYGFHEEEKEFGKLVCEEYVRRYCPAKGLFLAKEIKNSVHQRDVEREREIYKEIAKLIKQHEPRILLDIHHSKPIPYDQPIFDPSECSLKWKEPLTQRLYEHLIPTPILYWDDKHNPSLLKYLEQNNEIGGHVFDLSIRTLPKHVKHLKAAIAYKTAYFMLEAMLRGEKNVILEDDHYKNVFERTLSLIKYMEEFYL